MLKKLCEKVRAIFPATTPSCSVVKIGHLEDSSLNFFNPKQARDKANHSSKKKTIGKEKRGDFSRVYKPKAIKTSPHGGKLHAIVRIKGAETSVISYLVKTFKLTLQH